MQRASFYFLCAAVATAFAQPTLAGGHHFRGWGGGFGGDYLGMAQGVIDAASSRQQCYGSNCERDQSQSTCQGPNCVRPSCQGPNCPQQAVNESENGDEIPQFVSINGKLYRITPAEQPSPSKRPTAKKSAKRPATQPAVSATSRPADDEKQAPKRSSKNNAKRRVIREER